MSQPRLRRLRRAAACGLAVGLSLPVGSALAASPESGGSGYGIPPSAATNTTGHRTARHSARVSDTGHVYPGDSQHLGDRILRQGMRGHDVRVLQAFLTQAGYRTPVTGYFGSVTTNNVQAFQQSAGLDVTGVVTWSVSQALRAAVGSGSPAVSTQEVAAPTGKATIVDGLAVAPADAPDTIKAVIAAANKIATKPYVYGGGHGSWNDSGYDCSGSVSYALHGGGLLNSPEDSSTLESYGRAGRGQWITIWANSGHVFMYVAGLRFDTGAQRGNGNDRWTAQGRSSSGFVERHPSGF